MWILNLIPNELVYGVLALSLIIVFFSTLLYRIPLISQYVMIARTIATIVAIAMSALFGVKITQIITNQEVEAFKQKIAEAEKKSKETNIIVETKVVTKTKVIKEKADTITKYVDREIVKYDNTCVIPKEFIKAHNDAAEAIHDKK